jgi:hypothetical protein
MPLQRQPAMSEEIYDISALNRLNKFLTKYQLASGKTFDEVIEKKGNDLRIKLFQGYWEHRWGNKRTTGFTELRRRTRQGLGTLVRMKQLDSKYAAKAPQVDRLGRKLSAWQKAVWQEVYRRQVGVGILGVSFLSKRFREKKGGTRYLVDNVSKTFGTLVRIIKREHQFTIEGFTPGLAKVGQRYGAISKAINAVSEDMIPYLNRKLGEARVMAFGE